MYYLKSVHKLRLHIYTFISLLDSEVFLERLGNLLNQIGCKQLKRLKIRVCKYNKKRENITTFVYFSFLICTIFSNTTSSCLYSFWLTLLTFYESFIWKYLTIYIKYANKFSFRNKIGTWIVYSEEDKYLHLNEVLSSGGSLTKSLHVYTKMIRKRQWSTSVSLLMKFVELEGQDRFKY